MGVVVVGVDGSDASTDALRQAAREANLRGWPLRVVHSFSLPAAGSWTGGVALDPEPFRKEAERIVDSALTAVGPDLEGIEVSCVVELGGAVRVLLEDLSADDLVVVGSRGLGGFKGLLLGSVSHQIVLHAPCPVLVVRSGSD